MCRRAKALGYDESKELSLSRKLFSRLELCTKRFWGLFQPKPLQHILNTKELSQYHQATNQGDCKRAEQHLGEKFDAAHPDAPPHRSSELNQIYWQIRVAKHFYPSLGLCNDLQFIRQSLKQIETERIEARPFWSLRENFFVPSSTFPIPVRTMYGGVASLLDGLERTHDPKVALALLRLSREGKAIKLHTDYELYLALRLQGFGINDPLIDAVTNGDFTPNERARIAKKAKQKTSDGIAMFPN